MADHDAVPSQRPLTIVPPVRTITAADLVDALRAGYADFLAIPTHLVLLGLIYPIVGVVLATSAFGYDLLPLLFPLASGFALVGPFAGIGLYDMSRRREAGLEPTWKDAAAVFRSPAIGSVIAMGIVLAAVFVLWLMTAKVIFALTIGFSPDTYEVWVREILTTRRGWALIVIGNTAGFAFAVLVLTISVVAFPLIIDRQAGVGIAISTSRRAVLANPVTMALWGLIVATLLVLGSIPVFVGLAIAMPILGHATWHLYRKVVSA